MMYIRSFVISSTSSKLVWRRSVNGTYTNSIRGVNMNSMMVFIASSRALKVTWEMEGKVFDSGSQLSILARSMRLYHLGFDVSCVVDACV
jgi:glycerol kinase